jgi:hypothetical protein
MRFSNGVGCEWGKCMKRQRNREDLKLVLAEETRELQKNDEKVKVE